MRSPEDPGEGAAPRATPPSVVHVDLLEAGRPGAGSASGPRWGHESEDLDLTLLSWAAGRRIEPHVNHEVDVVWVGVEGAGVVTVDGREYELRAGGALVIPKGCERAVRALTERFGYLSVHRRRRGLRPTLGRGGRPL